MGKIDCYGFNFPDFDTGSWVDTMLDSLEEERLAAELLDLLENDMEVHSPIEVDSENSIESNTEEGTSSSESSEDQEGSEVNNEENATTGSETEEGGEGSSPSSTSEESQSSETESPDLPF